MPCRKRKEFPTIQTRGFPEGKGICAAGAEKGKEAIIMKKLLFTAFLTAALAAGLTASAAPADRGPEALRGPAAAPLVREDKVKDKDKDKGLPPGQAKKIGDRKKDLPPGIEKKLENRRDDRRDDRRDERRGDRRYDRYDRDDRDDRYDRHDRDDRHDRHDRRWDRDDDDDDDRDDFLSNLIDQIRK